MKEFTVNPLDVLEKRKLNFLPPHLNAINVNHSRIIDEWIRGHLKGRYYLGQELKLDDSSRLVPREVVAFEDPKEATIFLLSCPYLAKIKG